MRGGRVCDMISLRTGLLPVPEQLHRVMAVTECFAHGLNGYHFGGGAVCPPEAPIRRNGRFCHIGGPEGGLDTLAAAVSEDAGTLEDVYEPYLLKNGFIQRTPRGRVVTELAYRHLGIPSPLQEG